MTSGTARRVGLGAVIEHEFGDFRRYWSSVVIASTVSPLLYLLALGIGLGTVVNRHSDVLGVRYVVFVAPAFLVAAALQTATGSATFPVMAGFKWIRFYHGMAATPLTARQICDGKIVWIALRTFVASSVFFAITACFGAVPRAWAVLEIPIAVLTGLAFAAPILAISATVTQDGQAFNVIFRFVVTPMFLFSGTFYPISRLPAWGQWIARVSPLWHGVELGRGAAIGHLAAGAAVAHVAYLALWLVVGVLAARWRFAVRLERG